MTENEAIEVLKEIVDEIAEDDGICYVTDCDKEPLEMAMSALEEIQAYKAIGTVEEVRMLKDYKELYDVYKLIGTIEEFRNLKYKKNFLPIATIKFSKEDMQKMVDEKVAQIELDIQKIRANTIDEFAHQLKETLNQEFPSNYESTRPYFSLENARLSVDDVAEQMKGGTV